MTVVEALPMDIQEALYHYCRDDESLNDALIRALRTELFRWHDLRKNPGDLPKEYTEVLNDDGVKVELRDGHWRYVYGDEWEDDACVDHWCEIPEFKEA